MPPDTTALLMLPCSRDGRLQTHTLGGACPALLGTADHWNVLSFSRQLRNLKANRGMGHSVEEWLQSIAEFNL